jgi:N-acetylmuramoyl-L-alanine amidase
VGSPYVFVDDRGVNLYSPVRWHDGRIFVPVRLATDVLDVLVAENVSYDRGSRALRADTGDPNILGLDLQPRQNGTMAELRLSTALTGELEFPRGDQVVVRVRGGVVSSAIEPSVPGRGLVDSLTVRQDAGEAVFTFHLGPLGGAAELLPRTSPPRLLVVFRSTAEDDIPLPDYEGGARARDVEVVVIDPGHGGSDSGVTTPAALEKDVALAISRRLGDRLRAAGLTVHYTREGDRFLAPEERASLANSFGPDLIVSVHANGWFDESMEGFSVGIARPRMSAGSSEMRAWGDRDRRTAREEELAAEILAEVLDSRLGTPNRGVHRADYAPILGADAPAVLVECGFLTSPAEAARLLDPDGQAGVADALAEGILAWRSQLAVGGAP